MRLLTVLVAGLAIVAGCEQTEILQDNLRGLTPYETYQASLVAAGLGETALARDWEGAGRDALQDPVPVEPPFEEEGYITPEEPSAVAYLVHIPRGRKLTFAVSLESEDDTRLFIDLFRLSTDEDDPPRPVFSSDSLSRTFSHEDPWRAGDYVLRVQPELLRGGSYRVTLGEETVFAFPVEGHGTESIQSLFGAARDGGSRRHHGVDIFAGRGTPALAAAAGRAERVRTTRLGGKVVWIRDSARGASIYYAHLDSQQVSDGTLVERGDTIGFVGNTGNARTTPPHLHFGIYRRGEGPLDPYPFLTSPRAQLAERTADAALLGARVRPRDEGVRLRAGPSTRETILADLEPDIHLRVLGAAGEWFRVQLPGGGEGYVAARLTEPAGARSDRRTAPEQDHEE